MGFSATSYAKIFNNRVRVKICYPGMNCKKVRFLSCYPYLFLVLLMIVRIILCYDLVTILFLGVYGYNRSCVREFINELFGVWF